MTRKRVLTKEYYLPMSRKNEEDTVAFFFLMKRPLEHAGVRHAKIMIGNSAEDVSYPSTASHLGSCRSEQALR
jgi:hypothetical protein